MAETTKSVPNFRQLYDTQVRPALQKEFDFKNVMALPKVTKVCLNMGAPRSKQEQNPKLMDQLVSDMTAIAGQKAVSTIAKESIANFRVREGMKLGCRVTLRGIRMYEFLERLICIAIPRIRDFRGLSPKSFDGYGNYSMGIEEQIIFPEVDPDKAMMIHGMDITICTSAKEDKHALALLKGMGMPFKDK